MTQSTQQQKAAALLQALQKAGRPMQIWELLTAVDITLTPDPARRVLRQLKREGKITTDRKNGYLLYAPAPPPSPPA